MSVMTAGKKTGNRWLLYIVKCSDGTFYTGITNDLPKRIESHNNGKASRYTRVRLPVVVIYQEGCRNRSTALKKELRIKALTRKEKEKYIRIKNAETQIKVKRKGVSRQDAKAQRKAKP